MPVQMESEDFLFSQPPLQLEHGHVWPRNGQSVAPVSNSVLGLGEATGKGMKALSLVTVGSGGCKVKFLAQSWHTFWQWKQLQKKSSSWCKRST